MMKSLVINCVMNLDLPLQCIDLKNYMVVGPVGWGQADLNVETLLEVSLALEYRVEAITALQILCSSSLWLSLFLCLCL